MSPRTKMIGTRLLQAIPVVIGVVVITFVLTRALPGDPAVYFAGDAADEASIQQVRETLGLDKPSATAVSPLRRRSGARRLGQ